MTDADTPRVPEFRWAPVPQWGGAVYIKSNRGNWFELHAALDPVELPADAVKLGDVGTEMLGRLGAENMRDRYKAALESCEVVLAQCQAERDRLADELRNLRADIRAVLAGREKLIKNGVIYANELILIEMITAILDREPGREEPPDTVWNGHERVSLAQWRANHEDEVFERLPDEGSLPQYRLRDPGREEPCKPCGERGNCQRPEAADCIQKPVLYGLTVPDHISFTIDGGSYVHITCRWALEDDCSTTTAKGNLAWIEQFLRAHAHGHVVEHQPPSAQQIAVAPWCPACRVTVGESQIRVTADGKRRHATCGALVVGARELREAAWNVTEEEAASAAAVVVEHQPEEDRRG